MRIIDSANRREYVFFLLPAPIFFVLLLNMYSSINTDIRDGIIRGTRMATKLINEEAKSPFFYRSVPSFRLCAFIPNEQRDKGSYSSRLKYLIRLST